MSFQRFNDRDDRGKNTIGSAFIEKNGRQSDIKAGGVSSSNRDEPCSDAKFRANKFLRVHLQILKALYQQDSSSESIKEDGQVEERYWRFINFFLKERDACVALVQRAQRMRGIYEEAMEFRKNTVPFPVIDDDIIAHQVGSPQLHRIGNRKHTINKGARSNLSRSSAIVLITQPSPRYNSHRSSHAWTGTANRSGGRIKQEKDETEENGGNAFGIVSGLLKRKHRLASRQVNERTTNLRTLVRESNNRVELLQSRLTEVKVKQKTSLTNSSIGREDFLETKEEYEDCLVRIETKKSLW
eukprot:CAMPEP_0172377618 /NCGR_PEP_ID=MMETSP1060-20121228/68993_1 /TAXON_ID=37318 /ORGANISM="Pseudo-nitzschia pungens, Strain cf. cingulata" /LENGTH=298 /DNA_ID=CAMNT_0013105319 /DNA_START=212 /DNA_END=1105 /DNA_ORIENTATION=-